MVPMKRRIILFLFLCVVTAASGIEAPAGTDFETQVLTVWGLAGTPWEETTSPEEERSRAWMDALHHGYEQALNVPIMEGVTVKSALPGSPVLKERLGHLLLNCRKTFYSPDISGLVRCKIDVPFSGAHSLRSALFLAALRPARVDPFQMVEKGNATPEAKLPLDAAELPWKRLVIDARRLPFEPSLFPRFFAPDGTLLFQEARIPGPKRFSRPAVRFARSMGAAELNLSPSEVLYLTATTSPPGTRDLRITGSYADIFHRFCRRLEQEPEKSGEILIVFSDRKLIGGRLPVQEAKEEKGGPGKSAPSPLPPGPKK
jgi:hypothetical protein